MCASAGGRRTTVWRGISRAEITAELQGKDEGSGPTLAGGTLAAVKGITVSTETLRQMRIGLGPWRPTPWRAKRVFQVRERRPRFGELIQIDGSPHAWFEGRSPRSTLNVFIDDATGRLTSLRFAPPKARWPTSKRCGAA